MHFAHSGIIFLTNHSLRNGLICFLYPDTFCGPIRRDVEHRGINLFTPRYVCLFPAPILHHEIVHVPGVPCTNSMELIDNTVYQYTMVCNPFSLNPVCRDVCLAAAFAGTNLTYYLRCICAPCSNSRIPGGIKRGIGRGVQCARECPFVRSECCCGRHERYSSRTFCSKSCEVATRCRNASEDNVGHYWGHMLTSPVLLWLFRRHVEEPEVADALEMDDMCLAQEPDLNSP